MVACGKLRSITGARRLRVACAAPAATPAPGGFRPAANAHRVCSEHAVHTPARHKVFLVATQSVKLAPDEFFAARVTPGCHPR